MVKMRLKERLELSQERFEERFKVTQRMITESLYRENLKSYAIAIGSGEDIGVAGMPCVGINFSDFGCGKKCNPRPSGWRGQVDAFYVKRALGFPFVFKNIFLEDPDSKADFLTEAGYTEKALDFYYQALIQEDPRRCRDEHHLSKGKHIKISWPSGGVGEGRMTGRYYINCGWGNIEYVPLGKKKPINSSGLNMDWLQFIDPEKPEKVKHRVREVGNDLIQRCSERGRYKAAGRIAEKVDRIIKYKPRIPSST